MKIVHICLACFYVEGMGYQENILPKKHVELGYEVTVLTSDFSFNSKGEKIRKQEKEYVNNFGVHVKVLERTHKLPFFCRYGEYSALYEELEKVNPDIIFVHGGQFISLSAVIKYRKHHKKVRMYIDQHADYYNAACNTFKRKLVHKLIYGYNIRRAVKYCNKFWGVTPWRCEYLNDVYGVPKTKIDLLVMGGDEKDIHFEKRLEIRNRIREKLNIDNNDFVVITGGKIDRAKNIHLLMKAISEINREDLKLIVFGQPHNEMLSVIDKLSADTKYWLDRFF